MRAGKIGGPDSNDAPVLKFPQSVKGYGQFLLRCCQEIALSLGCGAARSLGFRAGLLLGYDVVPFLGFRIDSRLGLYAEGLIIGDRIAQNQPLAERPLAVGGVTSAKIGES